MSLTAAILCSGLLLANPPTGEPVERFFVTIFTTESVPFRGTLTHTFATICRAQQTPTGELRLLESHTISWMPATQVIRPALRPETGVNLPLAESLAWARRNNLRVSAWGPFACQQELYNRLRGQVDRLNTGAVKYKALDTFTNAHVTSNCYHALWYPVAPHRKYAGLYGGGDTTGGKTVHLFSPWLICPERTEDRILALLGLNCESLTRRAYNDWPGRLDALRSSVQLGHPSGQ